jgi:D-alanyl-lipoteichoic acid acyltransferase DltB (MBOAT superfamily)
VSFVSYEFLVLFGLVFVLTRALPQYRNAVLLVASYVFYGWWDWRFLGLMLGSSYVDYFCAHRIVATKSPVARRWYLGVSLSFNLGSLIIFKYTDFLTRTLQDSLYLLGVQVDLPLLHILLPLGISFYTFQTLSYTVDVYRGHAAAKSLWEFLLYVSFFPQLVAGPIERADRLLPQIEHRALADWDAIASGAQLALIGFFKKMVIADNLAIDVNEVFGQSEPSGSAILLATYGFAFQIYCDFSGYTDIARGSARMLGFNLCENFRLPLLARDPSDFWQRWHISLSTWIRDYIYIPLGGSRGGIAATLCNLMLTMFLAGLWHGASTHFAVWGLYHGVLLASYHLLRKLGAFQFTQGRIWAWIQGVAFFQWACVGWLLFRVESMQQCVTFLEIMMDGNRWLPFDRSLAINVLVAGSLTVGFQLYQFAVGNMEPWRQWPLAVRVAAYLGMFYAIVLLGSPRQSAFIYFQF